MRNVMNAPLLLVLAVLSLCACASAAGSDSAADDEFTLPSRSDASAKSMPAVGVTSVSGVLSFDDIEGGCAFIQTADGVRYEVLYPDGWVLDRAAATLHGPADEEAHAGQSLTVRGSVVTDRSSVCQVGPIFQASAVEIGHG
jgi:hypothetical protein